MGPGAQAGATGVEMPNQLTAEGPRNVARKSHVKEVGSSDLAPPNRRAPVHIWRVADLPQNRAPAFYEITNGDGEPRTVLLSKRKRQVLDLLCIGPVFAASPVRIGDTVHVLRREIDLDVETKMHPGDPLTGAGDYGSYHLRSRVTLLDGKKGAAA